MTCPATFHLCPRSAEHDGFSVLDRETGQEIAASSEADARQIAERNYPDCTFALSTIAITHPSVTLPSDVPDAIVVAIVRPHDDQRFIVAAYVVSSVAGAACIPFSQEIWPNIKDLLPHDHRRSAGSAS